MPVESVNLFFALLFVGAVAVVGVAAILSGIRLVTGQLPAVANGLVADVRPLALVFAWMAATTAMMGSLYYSEVAGFLPCQLCWVQRYFMYPSAIILFLALVTKRPRIAWLAFGLSLIGAGVSAYHRFQQQFPDLFASSCDPLNPCTGKYVETFGFITIPTMAFAAFALVLVFVPLALLRPKEFSP